MIGALLAVSVPGFALGALGMALGSRAVTAAVARARWLKFGAFCVIVHTVLLAAAWGTRPLQGLLAGVLVACAAELARAWRRLDAPRPRRVPALAALLATAAGVGVARHDAAQLVWCFIVVACADGFAQVTGQIAGRHAFARRLSPGKTREGALGGLLAALGGSVALAPLAGLARGDAALCGLALALAGLGGDLAASWVKRRAGLKDYSAALPGQGGFLDRFDSLIGALALLGIAAALGR